MMRFFLLFLVTTIASCVIPTLKDQIKQKAEFSNIITDIQLKTIMDEYFVLSVQNNIHFKKNVTIGFSNIGKENVIGVCTYGQGWREIDLDKNFWRYSSWLSKIALVYHESSHCYCERGHDYDNGQEYPSDSLKLLYMILEHLSLSPLKPKGYLDDGCPKSIMHPTIVDEECFQKHYMYYVKEMFDNCHAY